MGEKDIKIVMNFVSRRQTNVQYKVNLLKLVFQTLIWITNKTAQVASLHKFHHQHFKL